MRILANGRVVGLDQCPGFDCQQEPLPLKLQILLCLVDGAERRRQIQANSTYYANVATGRGSLRPPTPDE
jgi:hypothetical protein